MDREKNDAGTEKIVYGQDVGSLSDMQRWYYEEKLGYGLNRDMAFYLARLYGKKACDGSIITEPSTFVRTDLGALLAMMNRFSPGLITDFFETASPKD